MDIQDQCLDIRLCDKHLTYSVLISKYSALISKIFVLTYFNILDNKVNCSDIYLCIGRCKAICRIFNLSEQISAWLSFLLLEKKFLNGSSQ